MVKKLNYQQNLELHLSSGQPCKKCKIGKAKPYAVSNLALLTLVTYQCTRCYNIQDTLYNTSWYILGCANLGLRTDTLKPIDNTDSTRSEDNATNR